MLFGAPVDEVAGVEGDAEEVGGDETELGGADADDADDSAVDTGDDPALPELLADQDGGEHGQHAGQIIESNTVEDVQHVGPMSRCRNQVEQSSGALRFKALLLQMMNSVARGSKKHARVFWEMVARMTGEQPVLSGMKRSNWRANCAGPRDGVRFSTVTASRCDAAI